jgi:hypothetical protein
MSNNIIPKTKVYTWHRNIIHVIRPRFSAESLWGWIAILGLPISFFRATSFVTRKSFNLLITQYTPEITDKTIANIDSAKAHFSKETGINFSLLKSEA